MLIYLDCSQTHYSKVDDMQRDFTIFTVLSMIFIPLLSEQPKNTTSIETGHTEFFAAQPALIRRAAFDIGSLTTKMIVADVDTNAKTCKVILKDVRRVGYKHNLERPDSDGTLTPDIIQQGIQALKELQAEAQALSTVPIHYVAVATAALRTALNSQAVVDTIKEQTHIPVLIINQDEEARLGFKGALQAVFSTHAQEECKHAVVWDAGGGSMQMTTLTKQADLFTYGNELGFIAFAQKIMQEIQHKTGSHTPNPLSDQQALQAIELAVTLAQTLPLFLRTKAQESGTVVIGIGALYYATHGQPTSQQSTPNVLSYQAIKQMLLEKLDKTDEQLASSTHKAIPPLVSATSLALILGFMKALKLDTLTTVEVNMTDALLIDPLYFKE